MRSKIKRLLLMAFLLAPALTCGAAALFFLGYRDRIYPGVHLASVSLGGKTKAQALNELQKISLPPELELYYPQDPSQKFTLSTSELEISYNWEENVENAYAIGRNSAFETKLVAIASIACNKLNLPLSINYNHNKLEEYLSVVAGQIVNEPVYPHAMIENNQVKIERGRAGHELKEGELKNTILLRLAFANFSPMEITTTQINPQINGEEAEALKTRAEKLMTKSLILKHEYQEIYLDGPTLISFLTSPMGFSQEIIAEFIRSHRDKIERPAQNPYFVFMQQEGQGKVQEFTPAKAGIAIDEPALNQQIMENIKRLEGEELTELTVDIAVKETPADYKTEDVNNLGIKELIGRGQSNFRGSVASRVYNVNLAATRVSGTLIAPGEIFSFNQALGDVSKLTGYQEAYVIKDGKTVLGDGGGVCQVSTTLFRAALDAGLPVVERRAHSYRVGYYEQGFPPGFDATVYSPTTDLKFTNDTPGHILIQTYVDTKNMNLMFELYGTSDGREATTTKPVINSSIAPGEDIYTDDPTLPAGQIKQIEYKAWGAKVQFDYKVTRNGQTIYEKTFYSNYKPWQAVYLRGTGPIQ